MVETSVDDADRAGGGEGGRGAEREDGSGRLLLKLSPSVIQCQASRKMACAISDYPRFLTSRRHG